MFSWYGVTRKNKNLGFIIINFVSTLFTVAVESQETAVKCSIGTTVIWHSYPMKMLCSTLVMLAILVSMNATAGPMKEMGWSLR